MYNPMHDIYLHDFFKEIKESSIPKDDCDIEFCPKCHEVMYPVYENNGFDPSEGPTMVECVGWECLNEECGYTEE